MGLGHGGPLIMSDALTAVWIFVFLAFVTGNMVFLAFAFCAYMDYREKWLRKMGPRDRKPL
jgi:hypothetical protein